MTQPSLIPEIPMSSRIAAAFPSAMRADGWVARKGERVAMGLDCAFCFQLMPMNGSGTGTARGCDLCQTFGPPPAWWPDTKPKRQRRRKEPANA